MYTYLAFYKNKRAEVSAPTLYDAKLKAVAMFKPPKGKEHTVSVHLHMKGEEVVEHSTAAL